MKKIFGIIITSLLFFCSALKAQVTVDAFPANPQSGPHNYFGVRVTLSQTYSQDVIVTGYIYDQGNGANTNHPFSLTVTSGNLTAETASNFYETDPTAIGEATFEALTSTYANATITYEVNGCILKFSSYADLKAVINQLDADDDAYNDNYDSQYPNLSEEELDEMDEQNEFDEFKKFRDFEALFGGFCSKRAEIESIEATWLANSFSGTDPDDVDLTFDDAENTIFNSNYSFKIGNDIYQLTANGIYKNGVLQDNGGGAKVINGDKNIIYASYGIYDKNFYSGPMFSSNFFPVNYLNEDFNSGFPLKMTDCKSNKKKKESVVTNDNRRLDLKIVINSFWFGSSIKGKAVSFKKQNGNWKRKRTKMAVGCGGTVYEGDCNSSFQFTARKPNSGYDKRKRLKCPYRSLFQVPGTETNWKTYSGMLASTVDAPNINVAGTVVLTF